MDQMALSFLKIMHTAPADQLREAAVYNGARFQTSYFIWLGYGRGASKSDEGK